MTPIADIQSLVHESQGTCTLDPAGSSAEFHVKHFWGAITVHGRFERLTGEGTVAPDGTVTGVIRLDAASLNTNQNKRDKHLRSADFFDAEHHPTVTISVEKLTPDATGGLAGQIRLEAAGQSQTISPTIEITETQPDAVTLHGEVTVDRTAFGMTWSPLGMAAREARGNPSSPPDSPGHKRTRVRRRHAPGTNRGPSRRLVQVAVLGVVREVYVVVGRDYDSHPRCIFVPPNNPPALGR